MRGNLWSRRLGIAAVCVQAVSVVAVARSAKRAPLLDDAAAADIDLSQSVQRTAGDRVDEAPDTQVTALRMAR